MDSSAPLGIPGRAGARTITVAQPKPATNGICEGAGTAALVLDDCRFSAERLARTLLSRGITSVLASDGYVGLGLLDARRFILVVLAVELPFVDGFSVLRHLRKARDHAAIPVLMLGGDRQAVEADQARSITLGATSYLSRPLQLRSLNATLDGLLAKPSAALV